MDLDKTRQEICSVGKLLYERGYVVSNDGNVSVRVDEDTLLVTPSGVGKGRMEPDDLVLCDLDGCVLPEDTSGRHPSSEVQMHALVYAKRPDVRAVVHAHPVTATAFAICRRPLCEAYLCEMVVNLRGIPVADFALPSTDEVPRSILPYVHDHNGMLLANHGALAYGPDLWAAFDLMETIEHTAKVYAQVAAVGGGVELDEGQVDRLLALRSFYRQRASAREDDVLGEDSR